MKIETILTPAELPALARRDLRETCCVVFDVLRATSTIVTALHNGATAVVPVSEIAEALAFKKAESGKRKAEIQKRILKHSLNAPPGNSSSGAAKARRSSPAIRGFWTGDATR